ncbi:MAG: hypothetical protein JWM58_560 [Rhizobium sp.]|nr:hypothetical protein [Rhizobium sp.]
MNALSLEQVEPIARLWAAGKTVAEIVAETGQTDGNIRAIKQKHRHLFASRRPAHDEATIDEAARLWNSGVALQAVADAVGISQKTLKGLMTKHHGRFAERDLRGKAGSRKRVPAPAVGELRQAIALPEARVRAGYLPGFADLIAPKPAPRLPGEPIPLMETNARTCKRPVSGEGFSMLFCGGHFSGPGSYCAAHRKRAVWPRICEGAR